MAQPEFVPVGERDEVRPAELLPPPKRWEATRPGETVDTRMPEGDGFGNQGPDQGYALFLAKRFADKLELVDGEHRNDVINGCLGVATKRASLFGRGPVIYDWEIAFTVWGYLGGAPTAVVQKRVELFAEASHHYWKRRAIADAVPESTLRMTPPMVKAAMASGQELLQLP
ncbi:MAG TPA: hypothetical protein VHC63_07905 [Acidimicrobiales bacterium]|nr:hypothetical protein [Acidimicrobiales bacterium]